LFIKDATNMPNIYLVTSTGPKYGREVLDMDVEDFLNKKACVHWSWMGKLYFNITQQLGKGVNEVVKVAELKQLDLNELSKAGDEAFQQCMCLFKDSIKAAIARIPD
jgi:hypothetical protein